jgi:O-antigen chain-terminating methyltransferase
VQHLQSLQAHAERTQAEHAKFEGQIDHLQQLERMLVRLEERHADDAVYVKGELARHSSLLDAASRSGAKGRRHSSPTPEDSALPPDPHRLDSFYLSFENRFRGQRSDIKERVRFYLPFLRDAQAGAVGRPILDLGCGRGEWLELLAENGFAAAGVDLNLAMVAQCHQRSLAVTQGDALAHLRSLQPESQGAISGFHIIEHLPLETLLDLFREARRVLQPGGLAIFESPNCKNLMVGACNFNIDPTHRRPVYPETAEFMLATQGFEQIQIEYLSPVDTNHLPSSQDLPSLLQQLLYGPQDFAVLARKPAQ